MLPQTYKLIIEYLLPSGKLSILDLGCGNGVAGEVFKNDKFRSFVGVDNFRKYIDICKESGNYICLSASDIRNFKIQKNKYDIILLLQVIEHLTKKEAINIINRCKRAAVKKVIISTPNGECEQEVYDDNPLQAHKSVWEPSDLKRLNLVVYGQGFKYIYRKKSYAVKNSDIKIWQRILNPLTLLLFPIVLFFPKISAQLIAVYSKK